MWESFGNYGEAPLYSPLTKKFIAVAVDGNGLVGPTDSTNGPTQEAILLKGVDDAVGVEGCRWSNDKFIKSPSLLGTS